MTSGASPACASNNACRPRRNSGLGKYRIGEIMANEGNRTEAARYLKQASSDTAKDSAIAAEAQKLLAQIGGPL